MTGTVAGLPDLRPPSRQSSAFPQHLEKSGGSATATTAAAGSASGSSSSSSSGAGVSSEGGGGTGTLAAGPAHGGGGSSSSGGGGGGGGHGSNLAAITTSENSTISATGGGGGACTDIHNARNSMYGAVSITSQELANTSPAHLSGSGFRKGYRTGSSSNTGSRKTNTEVTSNTTASSSGSMSNAQGSVNKPAVAGAPPKVDDKKEMKVLIIEDTIPVQKLVSRWMQKAGCKVTCANNGKIGLNHLMTAKFDMAIVDFLMPVMLGITTMKLFKEWLAEVKDGDNEIAAYNRNVLIVGMSATALESEQEEAFEHGMHFFCPKPAKMETLRLMIDAKRLHNDNEDAVTYICEATGTGVTSSAPLADNIGGDNGATGASALATGTTTVPSSSGGAEGSGNTGTGSINVSGGDSSSNNNNSNNSGAMWSVFRSYRQSHRKVAPTPLGSTTTTTSTNTPVNADATAADAHGSGGGAIVNTGLTAAAAERPATNPALAVNYSASAAAATTTTTTTTAAAPAAAIEPK